MTATTPKATNIVWHEASVDRQARASQRGHSSSILWFTGAQEAKEPKDQQFAASCCEQ